MTRASRISPTACASYSAVTAAAAPGLVVPRLVSGPGPPGSAVAAMSGTSTPIIQRRHRQPSVARAAQAAIISALARPGNLG